MSSIALEIILHKGNSSKPILTHLMTHILFILIIAQLSWYSPISWSFEVSKSLQLLSRLSQPTYPTYPLYNILPLCIYRFFTSYWDIYLNSSSSFSYLGAASHCLSKKGPPHRYVAMIASTILSKLSAHGAVSYPLLYYIIYDTRSNDYTHIYWMCEVM